MQDLIPSSLAIMSAGIYNDGSWIHGLHVFNESRDSIYQQPFPTQRDIVVFIRLIRIFGVGYPANIFCRIIHPIAGICHIQRIYLSPLEE